METSVHGNQIPQAKDPARLRRLQALAKRLRGSMPDFMTQEELKIMREDAKCEAIGKANVRSRSGRADRLASDMGKYEVIICWSERDKAFVAQAPELPGCAADGATRHTALKNVETAIKNWIQTARAAGRNVPRPKRRLESA